MPGKVTRLHCFRYFMWLYVKHFVFSVQIQTISNLKERKEQVIAAVRTVSTESLEKVWKNKNSRIIHIITVNGGHI